MTESGLRLLCFDGGGVRGLASLFVLQRFLSRVGNPRPCVYFDMIAGTSTGGLIAIMLGRLEMTVEDCIRTYISLMDEVFRKKHTWAQTLATGQVRARYSSAVLKEQIQRVIEMAGVPKNAMMRDSKTYQCKTFVVAIVEKGRGVRHFTDFKMKSEMLFFEEVRIWEAALATCAAPTFFNRVVITAGGITQTFLDGGLGHNNPVHEIWAVAEEHFGAPIQPKLRCLLSIGTGKKPLQPVGTSLSAVAQTIRDIATQTEDTAKEFTRAHGDLMRRSAYFRLNPDDLTMELDAPEEKGTIAGYVEEWLGYDHVLRSLEDFEKVSGREASASTQAQEELQAFA